MKNLQPYQDSKGRFLKGKASWIAGKKITEEHRNNLVKNSARYWTGKKRPNISLALKGKKRPKLSGKNAYNWKGGTDKENAKRLCREWRIKNYDRVLYLNTRRRVRKMMADGFHTFGEWLNLKAQYNWTCPCCGKSEPEIKLTEDHIIPLTKGGSDNVENIQPLCKRCNSIKHTKIIRYNFEKFTRIYRKE